MALNATGEFSLNQTSSTFSPGAGGGGQVAINFEGTASGYGTVQGTLTCVFAAPDAPAGTCTWSSAGFPEGGGVIGATGSGIWEKVDGEHKWRVRATNLLSDGTVLASDGEIDLATRSFNGTLYEWT